MSARLRREDEEPSLELICYRLQQVEEQLESVEKALFNLQLRSASWGFLAGCIAPILTAIGLWLSWHSGH